ncbi:hypothetical protein BDF19DRAFT_175978 [Syncephalis fuscata]|nr:hypothetical protein BDF19DRAFT_175978 [Syncephalis fuscata]
MSIHRVGIGHHILHTALIRRGLKLATITTSSRCAYPTGGLRRSTLLNGDKLLKEANSDITENWSLLNKKPILSTVLLSARHKVRDWNSILRNDQTKVVAISHLPAIIDKNQHFCILMSDGQLVRILPLHKFFSIKTTLGEMLEDESLLKVTFDAQYMAQQLWRHDNVAVRNIVDIREIGWPGRKNGLGLDMVYTEAFKELHGRRVIESTRLINSDWGQDTITDEQSQYATNFIQSIYMMYLRLCALQQTSKGDVTDCQYQCYSGGSTIKKETVDGYLPRTVIGTARRGVLVSKTTATTPANLPFPSSPSGISKIEKRLTTKQVVAALEAHEKMRETTLLDSMIY